LFGIAKKAGVSDPWQALQDAAPGQVGVQAFLGEVDRRGGVQAWLARLEARETAEMARKANCQRKATVYVGDEQAWQWVGAIKQAEKSPGTDADPTAEYVGYDQVRQWVEAIRQAEKSLGTDADPAERRKRLNLPMPPWEWAAQASEDDLGRAAEDLLKQDSPRRLRIYLRFFRRRRFPLDPGPLIGLASDPDGITAVTAMIALDNIRHPDVRSLALRLMESDDEMAGRAVGLLVENYETGDFGRVEALEARLLDAEAYHAFEREALGFYAAHPGDESEERVLLRMYENGPCAHCRHRAVERLRARKRLPDWMAEECRYDSFDLIRESAAAHQV
jgi:hypothetical protein